MSPDVQTGPDTEEVMTSARLAPALHDGCQAAFDAEVWKPVIDRSRPRFIFERITVPLGSGLKLDVNRQVLKTRPLPKDEDFVLVVRRAGKQPLSGAITQYYLGVTRHKLELHAEDGHADRRVIRKVKLTRPHRLFLTELLKEFQETVADRAERAKRDTIAAAKLAKYQKAHRSPAAYI